MRFPTRIYVLTTLDLGCRLHCLDCRTVVRGCRYIVPHGYGCFVFATALCGLLRLRLHATHATRYTPRFGCGFFACRTVPFYTTRFRCWLPLRSSLTLVYRARLVAVVPHARFVAFAHARVCVCHTRLVAFGWRLDLLLDFAHAYTLYAHARLDGHALVACHARFTIRWIAVAVTRSPPGLPRCRTVCVVASCGYTHTPRLPHVRCTLLLHTADLWLRTLRFIWILRLHVYVTRCVRAFATFGLDGLQHAHIRSVTDCVPVLFAFWLLQDPLLLVCPRSHVAAFCAFAPRLGCAHALSAVAAPFATYYRLHYARAYTLVLHTPGCCYYAACLPRTWFAADLGCTAHTRCLLHATPTHPYLTRSRLPGSIFLPRCYCYLVHLWFTRCPACTQFPLDTVYVAAAFYFANAYHTVRFAFSYTTRLHFAVCAGLLRVSAIISLIISLQFLLGLRFLSYMTSVAFVYVWRTRVCGSPLYHISRFGCTRVRAYLLSILVSLSDLRTLRARVCVALPYVAARFTFCARTRARSRLRLRVLSVTVATLRCTFSSFTRFSRFVRCVLPLVYARAHLRSLSGSLWSLVAFVRVLRAQLRCCGYAHLYAPARSISCSLDACRLRTYDAVVALRIARFCCHRCAYRCCATTRVYAHAHTRTRCTRLVSVYAPRTYARSLAGCAFGLRSTRCYTCLRCLCATAFAAHLLRACLVGYWLRVLLHLLVAVAFIYHATHADCTDLVALLRLPIVGSRCPLLCAILYARSFPLRFVVIRLVTLRVAYRTFTVLSRIISSSSFCGSVYAAFTFGFHVYAARLRTHGCCRLRYHTHWIVAAFGSPWISWFAGLRLPVAVVTHPAPHPAVTLPVPLLLVRFADHLHWLPCRFPAHLCSSHYIPRYAHAATRLYSGSLLQDPLLGCGYSLFTPLPALPVTLDCAFRRSLLSRVISLFSLLSLPPFAAFAAQLRTPHSFGFTHIYPLRCG